MSTSPSRAPDAAAREAAAGQARPEVSDEPLEKPQEVLPFEYCEAAAALGDRASSPGRVESDAPTAAKLAAEREAQLRELGRQQGGLESRAKFEEQLGAERGAIAKALVDFSRERGAYYQKLEEETVKLALAIARKVIHREAQVDPLLLMGIVRVALERIEGASGVVLLVHPKQADEWRRYLASRMEPGDLPEIVEDAALGPQQCVLRTAMGTAELGLEVQMKEIEQGLMDLLAARPQGTR